MARHNREGEGEDQRGFTYQVSYQPDWLRHVKVSRELPNGRQSTKTLFRNPYDCRVRPPGSQVRTRITCPEQGVDVEVMVRCRRKAVQRVTVTCRVPGPEESARRVEDAEVVEEISFTLENGLPPAR